MIILYSCLSINNVMLWFKFYGKIVRGVELVLKKKQFSIILIKQILSDNNIQIALIFVNPPSFNYTKFCNFPENEIIRIQISQPLLSFPGASECFSQLY